MGNTITSQQPLVASNRTNNTANSTTITVAHHNHPTQSHNNKDSYSGAAQSFSNGSPWTADEQASIERAIANLTGEQTAGSGYGDSGLESFNGGLDYNDVNQRIQNGGIADYEKDPNFLNKYLLDNNRQVDLSRIGTVDNSEVFTARSGSVNGNIYAAVMKLKGMCTKNIKGTNGGRLACAAAVSRVLKAANIGFTDKDMTLSCDQLEARLKKLNFKPVPEGQVPPAGAIAFVGGGGGGSAHTGVTIGGWNVLNNGSSIGEFSRIYDFRNDKRGRARYYTFDA
jgi:hypothetical protein